MQIAQAITDRFLSGPHQFGLKNEENGHETPTYDKNYFFSGRGHRVGVRTGAGVGGYSDLRDSGQRQ
jgi:hypothetical protein